MNNTKVKKKIDKEIGISNAIEWSKEHPVKAGIIGLSGLFIARAVGVRKLAKFLATTGFTKAAMTTAKVASGNK